MRTCGGGAGSGGCFRTFGRADNGGKTVRIGGGGGTTAVTGGVFRAAPPGCQKSISDDVDGDDDCFAVMRRRRLRFQRPVM